MADQRLTDKTELAEQPNNEDFFHIVDVSDTSANASGTSKKLKYSNLILQKAIVSNIATTYDIDWNTAEHWDLTMTANTTITESNIPIAGKVKTITIELKGNFSPTLPVAWGVLGTYDGTNGSQLVVQSWDNGSYYAIFNDLV